MAYPTGLTWLVSSPVIGLQPITTTSTTQNHPLGMIVRAQETSVPLGECEFIYLKGASSTAAGDVVTYNAKTGATTRVLDDTGSSSAAVAMAACDASTKYGWYAISGCVPVNAATVAADVPLYLTGTAGQVDDAVVAGDLIVGMSSATTDSSGYAYATLSRPFISQTTS